MKRLLLVISFLLLPIPFFAQDSERFFHGSATLRQTGGPTITGAVFVQRQDREYGANGWCGEHWTIQFTPSFSDLSLIRDITTDATPDTNWEKWAWSWVVNSDEAHSAPGGWLRILSDDHSKMSMIIIPASADVRATLYMPTDQEFLRDPQNERFKKYQGVSIFTYGLTLSHPANADYVQIDLRSKCP